MYLALLNRQPPIINDKCPLLVILDSSKSEEDGGESGKEKGGRVKSRGDGKSPPLQNFPEIISRWDIFKETYK